MQSIALFMIVKNEENTIERCLNSVFPYVDYYLISDTGSTDKTLSVIERFLYDHKKMGCVFSDQWENFGKNRTKSMKNAIEWLKNENISLENVYLLTIDADMILKVSGDKPFFSKDICYLFQKNDDLIYSNIRLFKASSCIEKNIKCVGVTHEYWLCNDTSEDHIPSDSIWIDDMGDGGCKSDKFKRDIQLLSNGVEQEPENKRYWFYLARSYEDDGNFEKSLECYKKRIELGGWKEEIYISYKQMGHIYIRLKNYEEAIESWTKAYEILPDRIETLFYLSLYYQAIGQIDKSFYLLIKCYHTPYPSENILFIEEAIYEYKILEELSILCFRMEHFDFGRNICLELIFKRFKTLKPHIKESTKWNYLFYLKPMNFHSHSTLSLPLSLPLFFSTSAYLFPKENGNVEGIVRHVNYTIDNEGNYKSNDSKGEIVTKNIWYDSETKTTKECIVLPLPKREYHIKGIEDIRLIYDPSCDKYYGLGVTWEYGEYETPSVCFLTFNEDKNIDNVVQIPYNINICQKNWSFYKNPDNNNIMIVYSHNPLTILEYDKYENKIVNTRIIEPKYDLSSIRGSSNPIRIEDEYLFLVHQTVFDPENKRRYVHLFLKYSKDWELKNISDSFYFRELFIEFSLCIYQKDQMIYVPYSVKDNTTEIVSIPYKDIKWLDF